MNKAELAAKTAEKMDATNKAGLAAVEAVLESMTEALVAGETVVIADFGKFIPVQTKARTGRNPKTGDKIDIPAKIAIKFKPGKGLSDKVNDGEMPF